MTTGKLVPDFSTLEELFVMQTPGPWTELGSDNGTIIRFEHASHKRYLLVIVQHFHQQLEIEDMLYDLRTIINN